MNFPKIIKAIIGFLNSTAPRNTAPALKKEDEKTAEVIPEFRSKILYVNSDIGLRLRSSPEIKDNNKIVLLKHGSKVETIGGEKDKWLNKWLNIRSGELVGWVSAYYLTETNPVKAKKPVSKETIQDSHPVFRIGIANYAKDLNTKKVRQFIKDEFGGGINGWDLQCTEYAHYKVLQQVGVIIQWPGERPRHGGRWADIFKKHGMYKVLDYPRAGCTMSFTKGFKSPAAKETGHVAFVEQVFDDGSIRITEANWPPPGKYFERILPRSEWEDKWGGQFISFSS